MKTASVELAVGIFMLIGILCLGYLSVKMGRMELLGGDYYEVSAYFNSVSGLKKGSAVEIAGVEVGKVDRITLDPARGYAARVFLDIQSGVKLTDDTIAAVRTRGIIGDKFILLKPGGSEMLLRPGGKIRDTESAVDLEELLSKYIHGKI
jgi:phospholipid/cholesterol/gamma-HCH transport system substrate-binding protein